MSNSGSAAESARRGCAEQLFDKLEDATPNIADEIRNRDFGELVAESNREQEQFEQFVEDEKQAFPGDARGQFAIAGALAATLQSSIEPQCAARFKPVNFGHRPGVALDLDL